MRRGPDPPWWWKPHLRLWFRLRDWRDRPRPVSQRRLIRILRKGIAESERGETLDLGSFAQYAEEEHALRGDGMSGPFGRLPPLPDSAYPPDAKPLDEP